MTYKIWVWQLGDIFVVGVPGEPYTELQVMIREAVPEKHVIVSVNTNGAALGPRLDKLELTDSRELSGG